MRVVKKLLKLQTIRTEVDILIFKIKIKFLIEQGV